MKLLLYTLAIWAEKLSFFALVVEYLSHMVISFLYHFLKTMFNNQI